MGEMSLNPPKPEPTDINDLFEANDKVKNARPIIGRPPTEVLQYIANTEGPPRIVYAMLGTRTNDRNMPGRPHFNVAKDAESANAFLKKIFDERPEQTRKGVANAGQTLSLGALTEAWRREGYHEHLLRRYVWYRMTKQAPSRQDEVDLFVSQLFDKPWETRHWIPTTDKNDESDLRIHRAKKLNGGKT
ncbi:hypothetical protein AA0119_g12871 [Alternaria tenuissima]|uniref:Uncharacterized protein n=1 Tax=Alternaria tenuissima TaxID=119927 RepID=A0ABY0FTC2_9PLEO|nr:hypothetical protein AA0119_g12871 [Alternaria tenuissima]